MTSFAAYAAELLQRQPLGAANVVVLRLTDSSNLAARRIANEFAEDEAESPRVWLFAYEQSHGRGRLGRTWVSSPGRGVYATLLLPVPTLSELERLPLLAAVALSEEVEALTGRLCRVKWPNDLLIDRRKVGGVLIESIVRAEQPAVAIFGFGVNWSHTRAELPDAATSLALEMPANGLPSLGEAAARLAAALGKALASAPTGDYEASALAQRYRARSAHADGEMLRCSVGGGIVEGRFGGYDDRGFLRLETAAGPRLLSAGEVIER